MKNKIKWYPGILVALLLCVHCTPYDDYKKFMDGGDIIYPQKPDSLKTYPGKNRMQLEWLIVDPKVASCKIFYEQGGIRDSTEVQLEARTGFENDTTRVIISNLEETSYAFKIISFDALGNVSIPVETEELVYGDVYESTLNNRGMRSIVYDENEGLQIEWYDADNTEIGIDLNYTDLDDNSRTLLVTNSETSTTLADFKISEPVYYRTMHKPVPFAIDTFYAQTVQERIPYYVNITSDVLKNTNFPFIRGDMVYNNRYYKAVDWLFTVDDDVPQNGNIDNLSGIDGTLLMIASTNAGWPGFSITNGKLYQTVELEAGTYRYDVLVIETNYVTNIAQAQAYFVAALGDNLPGTNEVEQNALAFVSPRVGILRAGADELFSIEFVLTEKSIVSLGIVVNFQPPASPATIYQIHFRKFELWEKR